MSQRGRRSDRQLNVYSRSLDRQGGGTEISDWGFVFSSPRWKRFPDKYTRDPYFDPCAAQTPATPFFVVLRRALKSSRLGVTTPGSIVWWVCVTSEVRTPTWTRPCRFEVCFLVLGVQSGMVCSLGLGNWRQVFLHGEATRPSRANIGAISTKPLGESWRRCSLRLVLISQSLCNVARSSAPWMHDLYHVLSGRVGGRSRAEAPQEHVLILTSYYLPVCYHLPSDLVISLRGRTLASPFIRAGSGPRHNLRRWWASNMRQTR